MELLADHIVIVGDQAVATGHVTITGPGWTVTGSEARRNGDRVTVSDGEYRGPEGNIRFVLGSFATDGVTAWGVMAESNAAVVRAKVVRSEAGSAPNSTEPGIPVADAWIAESVRVEPCRCDDGGAPALTFLARDARLEGEAVILHGGRVLLFGVPVVPLPWARVWTDPDHLRLLFPELALGEEGARVYLPATVGAGGYHFTGGPAWRSDRGFRGELSVEGPPGDLSGALGWDTAEGRLRGAVRSEGGVALREAPLRVAWDGVVSDEAYAGDYGTDFLTRGVAWEEVRGLVETGDGSPRGRLLLEAPDDGSGGAFLGGYSWRFGEGATWLTPAVTAGVQEGLQRTGLGVDGATRGALGPFSLGARLGGDGTVDAGGAVGTGGTAGGGDTFDGGATSETGGAEAGSAGPTAGAGGQAGGELRVELPFWSEMAGRRWAWRPGLVATAGVEDGPAVSRGETFLFGDSLLEALPMAGPSGLRWEDGLVRETSAANASFLAGPVLGVETVGRVGILRGEAAVGYGPSGYRPQGALSWDGGALSVRVRADPAEQSGEGRGEVGPLTVSLGAYRGDTSGNEGGGNEGGVPSPEDVTSLQWGRLEADLWRLRLGAAGTFDASAGLWTGTELQGGYDDGCAFGLVTARWSLDREGPDLGLSVGLRR